MICLSAVNDLSQFGTRAHEHNVNSASYQHAVYVNMHCHLTLLSHFLKMHALVLSL